MKLHYRKVSLNGATIHYLEGGELSTADRSLLFLHGWPLSAMAFRASLEHLSDSYHIIAPDLPGLGRSEYRSQLQSYEAFSDFILDFLKALNINAVNLVGHSTGGGIVLTTAYRYPAVVHKLALLDSAGIRLQDNALKTVLRKPAALAAQAWETKFTLKHLPLLTATAWNLTVRSRSARQVVAIPLRQDLGPMLADIQCPCLVIWGKNDRIIPLTYGREIAARIPNAQLVVVENGYHEWSALKPKKLETLLSNFFE